MLLPYLMNLGMLSGGVIPPPVSTDYPDPFAASGMIKGADPFSATVVTRVDPFAASVKYKQS